MSTSIENGTFWSKIISSLPFKRIEGITGWMLLEFQNELIIKFLVGISKNLKNRNKFEKIIIIKIQ